LSECLFSSYYICRGVKPSAAAAPCALTDVANDDAELDIAELEIAELDVAELDGAELDLAHRIAAE
jgi:hypothetical protein